MMVIGIVTLGERNGLESAGGGIRTHAGNAHLLSRQTPYHSATPAHHRRQLSD